MNYFKILLTYKDENENFQIESVWGAKENNYFRIKSIPFFSSNIAYNDLISVENDDGALYFEELIEESGHSTIQLIIFDQSEVVNVCKELENLGCTWEGSHMKSLVAVDIPKELKYSNISAFLKKGEAENRWSFKEACLSHKE